MERYVHLIGAEQVQNASHTFADSARKMAESVAYMAELQQRFFEQLNEYVCRLEALKSTPPASGEKV